VSRSPDELTEVQGVKGWEGDGFGLGEKGSALVGKRRSQVIRAAVEALVMIVPLARME
jgi:hypothetical protein